MFSIWWTEKFLQKTTVYKVEIPVKDLPKEGLTIFEGKVASQSDGLAAGIDVKATGGGDQIFMSGKQSFTANNCAKCKITKIGGFEDSRQLRESLGLPNRLWLPSTCACENLDAKSKKRTVVVLSP